MEQGALGLAEDVLPRFCALSIISIYLLAVEFATYGSLEL